MTLHQHYHTFIHIQFKYFYTIAIETSFNLFSLLTVEWWLFVGQYSNISLSLTCIHIYIFCNLDHEYYYWNNNKINFIQTNSGQRYRHVCSPVHTCENNSIFGCGIPQKLRFVGYKFVLIHSKSNDMLWQILFIVWKEKNQLSIWFEWIIIL